MHSLTLKNIVKYYGKVKAVDGLSLEVKQGELVTLLGPSGCGKTSTLRSISGFLIPEAGHIFLGDREITTIPPEKRGIGLVFQNYALWPHMTVYQNLAFGLEMKKKSKKEIRAKVAEGLSVVQLEGYEERYPRQLSGGQQQRVALARALSLEPEILLLDEPLSNLDALLREQMRYEIDRIHRVSGLTTIYVTHDQSEAMTISDRIVIMNQGKMMQQGSPMEIYNNPANHFVAGFMGATTFISGELWENQGAYALVKIHDGLLVQGRCDKQITRGSQVMLPIRQESISLVPQNEVLKDGQNYYDIIIVRATYVGERMDYEFKIGSLILRMQDNRNAALSKGDKAIIRIDPDRVPLLKK